MTQAGGMWLRPPAAVIRRTGWGTAEDILEQPSDFPHRSSCRNPGPERIPAPMPGGVLECEQGETSRDVTSIPKAWWREGAEHS